MKILWLVNIVMPDFASSLGRKSENTGGWLSGRLKSLKKQDDIQVIVCTVADFSQIVRRKADGIGYIGIPYSLCNTQTFSDILSQEQPDVIHIFGTENPQSLYMAQAADYKNCLVTIQGVLSEYSRHYFNGMPPKYSKKNILKSAAEDLLASAGLYPSIIYNNYEKFCSNAQKELQLLKNAKYFSGRTRWDKAAVMKNNPDAVYFHLGESLRDEFYTHDRWSEGECLEHRIFVSRATYPIKGFHMLLPVAARLKKDYPNLKIAVGGTKPMDTYNILLKPAVNYFFEYPHYIRKLIKKYDLADNIEFLGSLNRRQMKNEYLKANAFILPSAIENSPNSLGEAMILGTPSVVSNVGGVGSMAQHGQHVLMYDFFDTNTMESHIRRIFENKALANSLSESRIERAKINHDRDKNTRDLTDRYRELAR